jgi:hypothetical protein
MEFLLIAEGLDQHHRLEERIVARYAHARECNQALLDRIGKTGSDEWRCEQRDHEGNVIRYRSDPNVVYVYPRSSIAPEQSFRLYIEQGD